MLSRVAENLYWLSRYVERAENLARLLDDGFQFELDAGLAGDDGASPVDSVLTILGCREEFLQTLPESRPSAGPVEVAVALETGRVVKPGRSSCDEVLRFLTFDPRASHSILSMIARARENARATQEALSAEAWSQVNRLFLYLSGSRAQRRFQASPFRFYDSIKRACVLFDGLVDSTLSRTEVFHFLQLGRYLERLDMMSHTLNVNLHVTALEVGEGEQPLPSFYWTNLLRSCSAYDAYLREHLDHIDPTHVVRFLILSGDFPRAMRFSVERCLESLKEIAGGSDDDEHYRSEAERLLGRFDGELRYLDPDEIVGPGLYDFLANVQDTCARTGLAIQQAYFLQ